jgi:hypothetical protein
MPVDDAELILVGHAGARVICDRCGQVFLGPKDEKVTRKLAEQAGWEVNACRVEYTERSEPFGRDLELRRWGWDFYLQQDYCPDCRGR